MEVLEIGQQYTNRHVNWEKGLPHEESLYSHAETSPFL